MVLVALKVVVDGEAGWCVRKNTERVWKLMIFGGEFPDSVGGNFFERLPSPVVGSTLEIELFFGNEAFLSLLVFFLYLRSDLSISISFFFVVNTLHYLIFVLLVL